MTTFLTNTHYADKKHFFRVQRLAFLTGIGFWPGSDFHTWQISFAIFNSLEILFYAIFQVKFCIENINDLVSLLSGFTPLVTQVITSIKILIIIWRRNDVKRILSELLDTSTGKV
jgi:hypothetical protein